MRERTHGLLSSVSLSQRPVLHSRGHRNGSTQAASGPSPASHRSQAPLSAKAGKSSRNVHRASFVVGTSGDHSRYHAAKDRIIRKVSATVSTYSRRLLQITWGGGSSRRWDAVMSDVIKIERLLNASAQHTIASSSWSLPHSQLIILPGFSRLILLLFRKWSMSSRYTYD
jgi:hypothetical protein